MNKLKVIPTVVNTEDLLAALDKPDEIRETEEILEYTNDILPFFSSLGITAGEVRIKKTTLHSIYRAWSKTPMNKTQFMLEIAKFLPVINAQFVTINKNAIKLTHEAYKKFNKENKRIKSKHWARHFEDFLNYHSLERGEYWLEVDIFYFLYDKYLNKLKLDNHGSFLAKEMFIYYADVFLKSKLTVHGKMYGVSENVTTFFQPDQLERMRKEYANQEEKPKKKRRNRKKAKSKKSSKSS